jgi:hypothetical protein
MTVWGAGQRRLIGEVEVNPQGQFLYIEILAGLPISNALAEFLSSD